MRMSDCQVMMQLYKFGLELIIGLTACKLKRRSRVGHRRWILTVGTQSSIRGEVHSAKSVQNLCAMNFLPDASIHTVGASSIMRRK